MPSATPVGAPTLVSQRATPARFGRRAARDPAAATAGVRRGENHEDAEQRAEREHRGVRGGPSIELELATDADRETTRERDRDARGQHRARARDREIPEHGGGTEGAVGAAQRTQRGCVAIVPTLLGPDQDPRGDRADECDADAEREERDRLDVDWTLD